MLTAEQNDELTQVEACTPMGEVLRRYWYPVAFTRELAEFPVKRVELLGEFFALWKSPSDRYGIVLEACPGTGRRRWPTASSRPTGSSDPSDQAVEAASAQIRGLFEATPMSEGRAGEITTLVRGARDAVRGGEPAHGGALLGHR